MIEENKNHSSPTTCLSRPKGAPGMRMEVAWFSMVLLLRRTAVSKMK
jgi:hypothetical protein